MSLLSADAPWLRQAFVAGRLTDSVTQRGIDTFDARLDYDRLGDGTGYLPFPARFKRGAQGYFVFHLDPGSQFPSIEGLDPVGVRVTFAAGSHVERSATRSIAAPGLEIVTEEIVLGGKTVEVEKVAGAPFDFSSSVEPLPVALSGYVFRDHDPEEPATGAMIEVIDPVSAANAMADAAGWFRIDALPVVAAVRLRVTDGARTAQFVLLPDFSTPMNETVLSVSTA